MTWIRFVLMLYFFMVAQKAARKTLSKAFLNEEVVEVLLVLEMFLIENAWVKICSVVLLPALKPACSSAMLFSACGFNLFSMIFSMTAWVTDEADCSVALALLQVAFLGKCDD